MRKSLKVKQTKEQQRQKEVQKRQRRHKRITLWLFIPFVAATGLFILSYTNWNVTKQVNADTAATNASKAAAAEYIKTGAAKKAEADAIAKMEAEMAAKAESEKDIASAKQTDPTNSASCGVTDPNSLTVVINKKHCFSPLSWKPGDLGNVDGFAMRQEAATQMQAMMQAAAKDGAGFGLSSAYRSYEDQQVTYNTWVQVNGGQAAADTVSARPGYSEHQTGLAADLKVESCVLECFSTSAAFDWLNAHAADYGFINRYPSGLSDITGYAPEPWHWRYVGISTAQDMKAKKVQTLEQYFGISGGSY